LKDGIKGKLGIHLNKETIFIISNLEKPRCILDTNWKMMLHNVLYGEVKVSEQVTNKRVASFQVLNGQSVSPHHISNQI
jgi:hypothetical protein